MPCFTDMYRARNDDLFDIGWEDYLDQGGLLCGGMERTGIRRVRGASEPVTIENPPWGKPAEENHH